MAVLATAAGKARERVKVQVHLGDFPLLADATIVRVVRTRQGYRWALRFERIDTSTKASLEVFVRDHSTHLARQQQGKLYTARMRSDGPSVAASVPKLPPTISSSTRRSSGAATRPVAGRSFSSNRTSEPTECNDPYADARFEPFVDRSDAACAAELEAVELPAGLLFHGEFEATGSGAQHGTSATQDHGLGDAVGSPKADLRSSTNTPPISVFGVEVVASKWEANAAEPNAELEVRVHELESDCMAVAGTSDPAEPERRALVEGALASLRRETEKKRLSQTNRSRPSPALAAGRSRPRRWELDEAELAGLTADPELAELYEAALTDLESSEPPKS